MERGLPVTRVISRMTLQQILARAVGEEIIMNESNVVDFEDDGEKVSGYFQNSKYQERLELLLVSFKIVSISVNGS